MGESSLADSQFGDLAAAMAAVQRCDTMLLNPMLSTNALRTRDSEWIVTRYADAVEVLSSTMSSAPVSDDDQGSALRRKGSRVLLFTDPPDHKALRQAVSASVVFNTAGFQRSLDESLDRLVVRGGDLVQDVLLPSLGVAVCDLLGLPAEHSSQVLAWARRTSDLFDPFADERKVALGRMAALDMMRTMWRYGVREPAAEGALQRLVAEGLDQRDLVSNAVSLVSAAVDTSHGLLSNGIALLASSSETSESLRVDPSLIPTFVEEVCRLDSPVQLVARTASLPTSFSFGRVEPGQTVLVHLGAANRDPAVFYRPGEFHLTTRDCPHLGFGWGIHRCLGSRIARAYALHAFEGFCARRHRVDVSVANAQRRPHPVFRSYDALPASPSNSL